MNTYSEEGSKSVKYTLCQMAVIAVRLKKDWKKKDKAYV